MARRELGARLATWRRAVGLSTTVAGGIIGAPADTIERIERDHGQVADTQIAALLTGYAVTNPGDLAHVHDLVQRASRPRWWQPESKLVPTWFERYLDLEQASSNIRGYECQWVPGLLQTRDYAHALISIEYDNTAAEKRVALRLRRQTLLTAPDPPTLWAVIDEAALRRPLAGPQVQRAQLAHLIEQTERPNVTLQIAVFARGGHPAAGGSFTLLTHPDDPDPTPTTTMGSSSTAYVEHLTGADYLDTPADVEHYATVMDRLGAQLDPPEATAAILTEIRAQL